MKVCVGVGSVSKRCGGSLKWLAEKEEEISRLVGLFIKQKRRLLYFGRQLCISAKLRTTAVCADCELWVSRGVRRCSALLSTPF
jgi:hypothetical protein